jgi:hypothetical protein
MNLIIAIVQSFFYIYFKGNEIEKELKKMRGLAELEKRFTVQVFIEINSFCSF